MILNNAIGDIMQTGDHMERTSQPDLEVADLQPQLIWPTLPNRGMMRRRITIVRCARIQDLPAFVLVDHRKASVVTA